MIGLIFIGIGRMGQGLIQNKEIMEFSKAQDLYELF